MSAPAIFRPHRFLIACGGTGGHLAPGIALAEGLIARGHEATLLISRKRVDARLIAKYSGLKFERMPGRPFSKHPLKLAACIVCAGAGVPLLPAPGRARWRPDVVVGFGGFTSAPAVMAGRFSRVPVALHESNRVPGLATRALGRFAARVYLPLGVALRGVGPSAARHAGQPVRREISRLPQSEARAALGLDPNLPVLAILGGSQGAQALNRWTTEHVASLAAEGIQVYCLTGLDKGKPEVRDLRTKNGAPIKAVFAPFCDRMAELLSASDLVISRAGAGTLAELIRCETPAILVPYPHAADDHQRRNADFFERQGGGLVVDQSNLAGLAAEVLDVIFNDWLLRKFRGNLRRMDRANSLDLMLADLEEIAESRRPGRRPASERCAQKRMRPAARPFWPRRRAASIASAWAARAWLPSLFIWPRSDLRSAAKTTPWHPEVGAAAGRRRDRALGPLPADCELVVYSSAIAAGASGLRRRGAARRLPLVRRGETLAEVLRERKLVAVCGAHGKTTTTAMLITALRRANFPAGYLLGGLFGDGTPPARVGSNDWVVAEIDESDGTISRFSPEIAVAVNLDWDHPDFYRRPAEFEAVFAALFARTAAAVLVSDACARC